MLSSNNLRIFLPINRKKNKLFVFLVIFSLILSMLITFTYYYLNSPNIPSDYPRINIISEKEDINNEDYIECTFEIICADDSKTISPIKSKIKVRGSFNAQMPKKGYRLELSKPLSLLGMRKDDDWQLFAMFMDLTNLRVKLSFDLWRSLEPSNPTTILPDSKYVCLYMNGKFQGLYLLAEKNDRRLFGLDDAKNNIYSSLVLQAGSRFDDLKNYKSSDWEQDWPNEDEGIYIKDDIMTNLTDFIRNTPDEEFFNPLKGIYSKFHKQNIIDFYLFNFFILHRDFWGQNYFLVRNTFPNLFYLVPWDFDPSFGQYLNRKYSSNENPSDEINRRNYLYNRLLNNEDFKTDAKNRWFQLREELWTEEFIIDMVTDMYEEIKDISELDSEIWYPWIFEENWEEEVNEAVKYLFEWIPNRLNFCDDYFENV